MCLGWGGGDISFLLSPEEFVVDGDGGVTEKKTKEKGQYVRCWRWGRDFFCQFNFLYY